VKLIPRDDAMTSECLHSAELRTKEHYKEWDYIGLFLISLLLKVIGNLQWREVLTPLWLLIFCRSRIRMFQHHLTGFFE
jgi:hypothetical protein